MIGYVDLIIIFTYLACMLLVATLVGRKETLEDFLVNRRRTKAAFLIFTVISTNVGAGTLVAVSSAGYTSGLSYALMGAIGAFVGFIIVALISPKIKNFGDKTKAHTLGDFFGERYSLSTRILTGLIILVSYFFWTALQFVAIAALLAVVTGLSITICLFLSSIVVILYTTIAGIKSDFYTDAIQFWMIIAIVFCVVAPLSLLRIGGIPALKTLPASYFSPFGFGGPVFFFFGLIFGSALLLVSMEIWQRVYAAASPSTARKTFFFAAVVNIPMLVIPGFLGMTAALLFKNINPDLAFFKLLVFTLPTGLLGLGLAGLLAALMSTVDSMIMVGSATLLKDFYKIFRPSASESTLLRKGRLFTFLFGLIALLTAHAIPNLVRLQLLGFFTLLVFAPAVVGGFFWKKATSKAAFISILLGFIITMVLVPFMPLMAFVPGFLTALLLFVLISLKSHSSS